MFQVQVTMYSDRFKPVSCVIACESKEYFLAHKEEVRTQGIIKICQKRLWNKHHVKEYGYTKSRMREYDEQKIKQIKVELYEQIKKERGWA